MALGPRGVSSVSSLPTWSSVSGGYASAPTVLAGWLQRVPCVLLEPNAIPGLANRFLSWFATRVCLGFETAARFFSSHKVVHTGNPVRSALRPALQPAATDKPFTILVFGGSAGAHRLNHIVPQALARLDRKRSGQEEYRPNPIDTDHPSDRPS